MKRFVLLLFVFLVLALVCDVSIAQTNSAVNDGVQFNFSAPGARSLALGGAFIGLADDATAAFTNPAGLTTLSKPEISAEFRNTGFKHVFTDGGRIAGGDSGIEIGTTTKDVNNISFLSFVYPQKNWALAFYRHELANFENSFKTQGLSFIADDMGQPAQFRFFPVMADFDLDITNFGLSLAFKANNKLSFGIGVSNYIFSLDSLTRQFDFIGDEPPDFSPENVESFQKQDGGDEDVALIFGFKWKVHEKWSLGGVYREGADFTFNARNVSGPKKIVDGMIVPEVEGLILAEQTGSFKVPDVYGLGIAIHPSEKLTISLDYDHIEYSVLAEDTIDILNEPDVISQQRRMALDRLTVDDADELHLGIEYVLLGGKFPVALRFGGWYDPDHRIRFEGEPDGSPDQISLNDLFSAGDDEFHYSFGLGLVFGENFQLDAAADFSDLGDIVSLSGVLRF